MAKQVLVIDDDQNTVKYLSVVLSEHGYDGRDLPGALRQPSGSPEKTIREMRHEGLIRPEMFVDKPVDPDGFIARVKQLIGT